MVPLPPFTYSRSPSLPVWAASGAVVGPLLPSVAAARAGRPVWTGLPWAGAAAVAAVAPLGCRSWSAGRAAPASGEYPGMAQLPPSAVGFGVYRRM